MAVFFNESIAKRQKEANVFNDFAYDTTTDDGCLNKFNEISDLIANILGNVDTISSKYGELQKMYNKYTDYNEVMNTNKTNLKTSLNEIAYAYKNLLGNLAQQVKSLQANDSELMRDLGAIDKLLKAQSTQLINNIKKDGNVRNPNTSNEYDEAGFRKTKTNTIPDDINQSGITKNNLPYDINWNDGSNQQALHQKWSDNGKPSENGIATINGRYVVAVTPKFGKAGDMIDVNLKDGTTIPCVIGDVKGPDAKSDYGHVFGDGTVDVIEWCAVDGPDNMNIDEWKGINVESISNIGTMI
ncbi:MAG: hypothetical protein K6C11_02535 [Bacilli bacterium]|nr:hypothetical protein [Bacilli bacterium]